MSKRTTSEADRLEAIYTWLPPAKCGERLGVSADTIISAIDAGELRALDVSRPDSKRRTFRIRPEWLDEWVESRTVNAETDAA